MRKNIYIFSNGELKREENTLSFISGSTKKFIPITSVSSIFAFGELSLNKKLLEFLSVNHIIVNFFNYYGYYIGSYYPRAHYNAGLITLKQAEHYLDYKKRLWLACKFLMGGVSNMIRTIDYYSNTSESVKGHVKNLNEKFKMLLSAETIEELMAAEGNIREEYYLSFNDIIGNSNFEFYQRERRPPKGPLNALISFGNSMLYVTILGEIYKTHVDPRIGYLHSTNLRKFSLNLDLSEIFKPIIVDRIIFSLINKKIIKESDFDQNLGGTYLNQRGREAFVKQYEEKLNQTITIERRKFSYQMLIRLEIYKLEKHFIGEKEYTPYVSQW